MIAASAFCEYPSLTEVIFMLDGLIREMHGFRGCMSLNQIDIPASAEIITESAFSQCVFLTEVTFLSDSHIREVYEFQSCESRYRIDIPASTEMITPSAFDHCLSLALVIFAEKVTHKIVIHGFLWYNCRTEMPLQRVMLSKHNSSFELVLDLARWSRRLTNPI
jgi:hypothetical protein